MYRRLRTAKPSKFTRSRSRSQLPSSTTLVCQGQSRALPWRLNGSIQYKYRRRPNFFLWRGEDISALGLILLFFSSFCSPSSSSFFPSVTSCLIPLILCLFSFVWFLFSLYPHLLSVFSFSSCLFLFDCVCLLLFVSFLLFLLILHNKALGNFTPVFNACLVLGATWLIVESP